MWIVIESKFVEGEGWQVDSVYGPYESQEGATIIAEKFEFLDREWERPTENVLYEVKELEIF